jgi:general secretion pathway protein D
MKCHFSQPNNISVLLILVLCSAPVLPAQSEEEISDVKTIEQVESEILTQASAEGLSDREKVRRVEDSLRLSRALDEAKKIAKGGDFTRAQTRLEDVISKTSPTGPYSEFYYEAYDLLAQIYAARASQDERERNWGAARANWQEAVKYAPRNEIYNRKLEIAISRAKTVEEQYPESRVADQDLQDRVNEIQRLVNEGDSYFRTGQYSLAISSYRNVLAIDPYNRVARIRIENVEKKKKLVAGKRRRALKEERLREVEEMWSTEIVGRVGPATTVSTDEAEVSDIGNIFNKLDNIVIPSLNFRDINIVDAIDFLREQSVALDPQREGVNIVLKTSTTVGLSNDEGGDASAAATSAEDITFSLNVVNQPLITILDFIKDLTPLKYEVEDYAVFIFPKNETSQELLIRTYSVPPTFFSVTPTVTTEDTAIGGQSVAFVTADVRDELQQKGVDFPSGASAAYLPKTAKMVVKNTLEQLNLIDQLLTEVSDEATQIEIETKYVEFTEDDLKDFSFNWRLAADLSDTALSAASNDSFFFGSGAGELTSSDSFIPPVNDTGEDGFPNFPVIPGGGGFGAGTSLRNSRDLNADNIDARIGAISGRVPAAFGMSAVLDGNGLRMLLTALDSQLGADLLSAPKVTVVNNEQTKIRIAREFLYPTDFEPPEVANVNTNSNNNNNGNSVSTVLPPIVTPATPDDFDLRDVGVVLEVRANATPDRRIELDVNSDVTEFQGFINYADDATFVEISRVEGDDFAAGEIVGRGVAADGFAIMPVFGVRRVETKVQVIDGQTVLLGGFIRDDYEEIEDKVPLLGDLPLIGRVFRSKAERSIKRNLMIFITARIINADGTPRYLTTSEAEEFGMNTQP